MGVFDVSDVSVISLSIRIRHWAFRWLKCRISQNHSCPCRRPLQCPYILSQFENLSLQIFEFGWTNRVAIIFQIRFHLFWRHVNGKMLATVRNDPLASLRWKRRWTTYKTTQRTEIDGIAAVETFRSNTSFRWTEGSTTTFGRISSTPTTLTTCESVIQGNRAESFASVVGCPKKNVGQDEPEDGGKQDVVSVLKEHKKSVE